MQRQVTPTQLALFSRSPIIGSWWEELNKIDAKRAPKPKADSLDEFLFKDQTNNIIRKINFKATGDCRL